MKILCICDQGNNRSVTFAHLLKYWGNDTLSAGLSTTTLDTMKMLCEWADKIVVTASRQSKDFCFTGFRSKIVLCDVGPDTYPRPFNRELLVKAKQQLELHRAELHDADEGSKMQKQYTKPTSMLHSSKCCGCAECISKYEQSITR